jgi:two-component system chemotaxis response regulator CheB
VLSSANPLLESAAGAFGDRTIAVVLTGSGLDATDGVQTVKARGGIVIAQDPASADFDRMPQSAVSTGVVDHVLPLEAIAPALVAIVRGESVEGERTTGS